MSTPSRDKLALPAIGGSREDVPLIKFADKRKHYLTDPRSLLTFMLANVISARIKYLDSERVRFPDAAAGQRITLLRAINHASAFGVRLATRLANELINFILAAVLS